MDQARNDQSISRFRERCMDLGVQEIGDSGRISIRYSYELLLPSGVIEG